MGLRLSKLMVIVVILVILAPFVINPWEPIDRNEASQEKAKTNIAALDTALEMYKVHNGTHPTTEQGLYALIESPVGAKNWKGPYLKKRKILKDPWDNDFVYLSPGIHGAFNITSYGADGTPEGEGFKGDIHNWEI
ncbi:type II secretion system major pseudopilin GspG [Desulfobacterales bacterium HSG2]|nr:type II secretion system major pseudopilin GspG [Desulfobacterales bacterium HSG2]